MHTTNSVNTFSSVADDCPTDVAVVPPERPEPTVARLQYEMIAENPYRYTSDDVIFAVHARRKGIQPAEMEVRRAEFFSRGQACLRSSPLGKRYGWGIHHDAESRVALHPRESDTYRQLSEDPALRQVKAMRSTR